MTSAKNLPNRDKNTKVDPSKRKGLTEAARESGQRISETAASKDLPFKPFNNQHQRRHNAVIWPYPGHEVTGSRTPPPPCRSDQPSTTSLCLTFPPLTNVPKRMTSSGGHPFDATVKVILLGDYNVGKTSMLHSLSRSKDENGSGCCCEFRPGELVTTILKRDRKRSLVKVMDTGGQEKYRSLTASYYRGVHGCLLVFDVTREETFSNIMNWHSDLYKYAGDQFVTSILVGTTSHMAPRAVTPERAFKMAESLGVMYLECDVDDDVMIVAIIQRLLDAIVRVGLRKVSEGIQIKPQDSKARKCAC